MEVKVYTDGSCHTQNKNGAWVAILMIGEEKTIISGKENDTTHNRMELIAVLKAIEYIRDRIDENTVIAIYSDSQYVIGLREREEKLTTNAFITKKGNELNNADLVKSLFKYLNKYTVEFIKVKAHQKKTSLVNYNIEADNLSRKLVRENDAVK